jgi:hypothetical protein
MQDRTAPESLLGSVRQDLDADRAPQPVNAPNEGDDEALGGIGVALGHG